MPSTINDESWNEAVKDVIPLKNAPRDNTKPQVKISVTPKITPNLVYSGEKLKDLAFGDTANIDANTARRFHKGEYKIQAELDLHGCIEDVAFEKVIDFIKNSYIRGLRCISIITGKGLHIEKDNDIFPTRGVLKERVPQWLNLPEIRPLILAIDHPQPPKGGSGAVIVLLRRKRV